MDGLDAELRADELVRAGMLAKINRCNPGGRPCIRVNEAAGPFGDPPDHRVSLGC